MRIFIQHMVSLRCKLMVDVELRKLGLIPLRIDLGAVELLVAPTAAQLSILRLRLNLSGLEIIEDKRAILIENIKISVIEWIHYSDHLPAMKISKYLSEHMGKEYHYMSDLFSKYTGNTIEHFVITHKIERIKELLFNDQLTITEIAWKLNYSSVAHLSNQFKKNTGFTPSMFKKSHQISRKALDSF